MGEIAEKATVDEVLQETRRIKESLAKSQGFDVRRILNDARQRQQQSGRVIVSPPQKP